MTQNSKISFDTKKVYFFSILVAGLYGLSPIISRIVFQSDVPQVVTYFKYFCLCATIFLFTTGTRKRKLQVTIQLNTKRLQIAAVVIGGIFIFVQLYVHGDFVTAFIVPYTERTGTELTGPIRFIFYPATVAFTSVIFLMSIQLHTQNGPSALSVVIICLGTLLIAMMGSRNILLWSYSLAAAQVISKSSYRRITIIVAVIFAFAMLFAFARNAGLIAYLTNSRDQIGGELDLEYLDPLVHEFGSSYRTFALILETQGAEQQLRDAPYSQLSSFFINQMPSILKPSGYIGFTDYISILFAAKGEGIGSSPMLEAYISNLMSTLALFIVSAFVFWPAYYLKRYQALRLYSYGLAVAVSFNIWRIGSAEIFKMFLSSLFMLIFLSKICKVKVKEFNQVN